MMSDTIDPVDSVNARGRKPTKASAAALLSFAATPAFALMALVTGVSRSVQPDIMCSALHDASPLGGMVPMYLLMSAFHSAPWLKLMRPGA